MATKALEYPIKIRMGKKGQLKLPKQFCEALGLGTGNPFIVLRLGNGLILFPEQQYLERPCQKTSAALTVAPEKFLATLPQIRKLVFARKYGELKTSSRNK